jgi:hypothetical protein
MKSRKEPAEPRCEATKISPTALGDVEHQCWKEPQHVEAGDPQHEAWSGPFPIRWVDD